MKRTTLSAALAALALSGLLVSQTAVGAPELPARPEATAPAEGSTLAPSAESVPIELDSTRPAGILGRMESVIQAALKYVGVPYRRGGNSAETGFDCSGLVHHVFKRTLDVLLPRSAAEMAKTGVRVDPAELVPGDLVFFNTRGRPNSHVGIYLGESKFVHATQSGSNIRVDDMRETYYRTRLTDTRRVEGASSVAGADLRAAVARIEPAATPVRVEPPARSAKRPVARAAASKKARRS